ncbi:2-oxo-4-hydroxy-4-carboxy-5-ureidoimidazoline decarboxylase-like [Vanessa tameamea]|uniref:2-oxo-4-hydroxy-4-carboxy-5-ureidoimidazoline decarboxylase n=1 Tax=Vanessa tameamea TaxID=334116 RepID=A0A8B8I4S1_VANTA|nr:2-oxo-4-hydroxy-4-carboxy-5-ureidoimidazoline decarboxylase-like [Vanessa tameamea]
MEGLISISEVNSMNDERFEWVFRNVIELCSEAAAHVKHMRPFKDVTDLCAAFYKYLNEVSYEEKLKVLMSHPDLAGRLAAQGELTQESASEQQSAGLSDLSNAQKAIIDSSNKRYKEKFGFPFIICARENKVQSIIDGLNLRYGNTRDEEINIGINEVKKICKLRILDIVKNE